MTDPILRLEPARLSVEPGGQATVTLTVTNPGNIVEGYSVDVVSTIPIPWVEVNPSTLSVYPQQEATTVIVFAPPSGSGAPSGTLPFGVRVWSEVEGGGSAVAEGDLDIGSVAGLQAKLTPIASTGRWSGRHTLTISNWGNSPARLRIVPEDPDQALGFLVSPEVVDVPLGGEAVARLRARTRHPTLRGAAQRLPFQVVCEPDVGQEPGGPVPHGPTAGRPVVDGAFNQKPILTRWVVVAAGLVLLALIAGLAYLLTREDEADPEDPAQQPDQPTGFAAVPTEGVVTLSWDRVAEVQDYKVLMTAPVTSEAEIDSAPAAEDPDTRMESRIKVETEDTYCYQLVAVREGAPDSAPSEPPVCVDTLLPASATEGPTASPSIVPLPPEGGDSGGDETSGGSTQAPSEDPLPFVSILSYYPVLGTDDQAGRAEAARSALGDLGVDAKVLFTDEWTITPPLPGGSSYVLYVDGATAEDAILACNAVARSSPAHVPGGCVAPRSVAPK